MKPSTTLLLAALAVLLLLSGCTESEPTTATTPTPLTSTETSQPVVTQQTSAGLDQPHNHDHDSSNTTPNATASAQDVAAAFGCGWWAQPLRNETIEERVDRLSPYITNKMKNAIAEIRLPDDPARIETQTGAITHTNNTYTINCATTRIETTGLANGPYNYTSTITVTEENDTWLVTNATLGGLTLP